MSLKKAYLYLVSVITIIIWVVGGIMLLNLGLKTWVFTKADQSYYSSPCAMPVSPDGKTATCTPEQIAEQKKQDEDNRKAQKQSEAAQAVSMIIIAAPVWWFHWRLAKREV